MGRAGRVQGAAAFTKALKEYGYGVGMSEGIKRIAFEQKQQGFRLGVNYVLQQLSPLERLMGRPFKKK